MSSLARAPKPTILEVGLSGAEIAALGAIAIALGTLVSLLISEYTPLFGFMESGYRLAIVPTLVSDGMTALFLGFFLLLVVPGLIHALINERRSS